MLVVVIAALVQAFAVIKVAFLAVFLCAAALDVVLGRRRLVFPRLITFYVATSVLGIIWAIVGLVRPGNFTEGATDALRLYVVWSLAFLMLFTLVRSGAALRILHESMIASGIVISVMNLGALADQLMGLGLISDAIRDPLQLYVGLHDGYVQITSNNIGPLFVVVPYLIALKLRADLRTTSRWVSISLWLSLAVTVVSGRRALWLVVALTPCVIIATSWLSGSRALLRRRARRVLYAYSAAAVIGAGAMIALPSEPSDIAVLNHIQAAFSSMDERSIQKPFLVRAFLDHPVLGSGFGGYAGYVRNAEKPWTGYELTYYQMLFNLGVVGVVAVGALFGTYVIFVIQLLRRFPDDSAVPFSLLVGFLSLLIGAYSNRYFGSFDLLFFVGILPVLATFRRGFPPSIPPSRVSG